MTQEQTETNLLPQHNKPEFKPGDLVRRIIGFHKPTVGIVLKHRGFENGFIVRNKIVKNITWHYYVVLFDNAKKVCCEDTLTPVFKL